MENSQHSATLYYYYVCINTRDLNNNLKFTLWGFIPLQLS